MMEEVRMFELQVYIYENTLIYTTLHRLSYLLAELLNKAHYTHTKITGYSGYVNTRKH
jgi:hypothetical protein